MASIDPRFARLHSDPRFRRAPKRERKVKVDRRFASMFTDERFATGSTADKYGRKRSPKQTKPGEGVDRLYELDDEEEDPTRAPGDETERSAEICPDGKAKKKGKASAVKVDKRKKGKAEAAGPFKLPKKAAVRTSGFARLDDEAEEDEKDENIAAKFAIVSHGSDAGTDSGVESDLTEEASSDDDDMVDAMDGDEKGERAALIEWIDQGERVPRVSEGTYRLAVVNLNWDQVRAVDILAVLRSFEPSGGSIRNVAVYLSDFGEQQLKLEATMGPVGAWQRGDGDASDGDASSGAANRSGARGARSKSDSSGKEGGNGKSEVDMEALRRYELSRFRYYYAVVTCDSVATAEHIYAECDGAEFENSAMVLDLRFIPDDMQFTREPRDTASTLPPKYSAPSFACSALQQSNVKLSWDADDSERTKVMKRDFTKGELREQEYASFIASSSDSDGEEEWAFEGAPPPPKKGHNGGLGGLLRSTNDTEGMEDEELDREATFDAFDSKSKKKRAQVGGAEETVWQAQQRKMAEKRRARRKERGAEVDGDCSPTGGESDASVGADDPLNDNFFADAFSEDEVGAQVAFSDDDVGDELLSNGVAPRRLGKKSKSMGSGGKSRKVTGENSKQTSRKGKKKRTDGPAHEGEELSSSERAELELLMLGDGNAEASERGYDMRKLELPKGKKHKGGKNARQLPAVGTTDGSGFSLDMDDPRFSRLFVSSDFAVDPNDPKFIRTSASEALLAEVSRRHDAMREAGQQRGSNADANAPDFSSLSSLVSSVKRKTAAARTAPSKGSKNGLGSSVFFK